MSVHDLVKEVQEYERRRAEGRRCGMTSVQPRQAGHRCHAGTVTHVCERPADHKEMCRCWCTYEWLGK